MLLCPLFHPAKWNPWPERRKWFSASQFRTCSTHHFRIWSKSALCPSRTAAVLVLPHWSVGPVVSISLQFSCYRMIVSVGTARLYCRILRSNGAAFGPHRVCLWVPFSSWQQLYLKNGCIFVMFSWRYEPAFLNST